MASFGVCPFLKGTFYLVRLDNKNYGSFSEAILSSLLSDSSFHHKIEKHSIETGLVPRYLVREVDYDHMIDQTRIYHKLFTKKEDIIEYLYCLQDDSWTNEDGHLFEGIRDEVMRNNVEVDEQSKDDGDSEEQGNSDEQEEQEQCNSEVEERIKSLTDEQLPFVLYHQTRRMTETRMTIELLHSR
jgi:hypothetical protein